MDHKTLTIAGAAAALAAGPSFGVSATGGPAVPVAASYSELLTPIPNAVERLKASDAEWQAQQPRLIQAQYVAHHHHHHHHYRHTRRWYLRNGYVWSSGVWVHRPRRHHHHHHHHSHY